jgi:hypothetical protein
MEAFAAMSAFGTVDLRSHMQSGAASGSAASTSSSAAQATACHKLARFGMMPDPVEAAHEKRTKDTDNFLVTVG